MKPFIISSFMICLFVRLEAQCGFGVAPKDQYLNRGNRHEGFITSKDDLAEIKIYGSIPTKEVNVSKNQIGKIEEIDGSDIIQSKAKLKIIHFTYGEFKFANNPTEEINLRAFNPELPMKILARDIPGNGCYAMYASLSVNSTLTWPVSTVLLKKDFTSDFNNIGVVGISLKQGSGVFHPLISETKQTHKSSSENYFVIKINSLGSLSNFQWQLDNEAMIKIDGPIPDGAPIRIIIPRKNLQGEHKLNIYYKAMGERKESSDSFSLYF